MPQALSQLTVAGLDFSYGDRQIFEDFQLETTGNVAIFTGPSGSGKTTLLKLLSRQLAAKRSLQMPPSDGAFLIIQEDGLLPWLSGWRNICEIGGIAEEKAKAHPMYPAVAPFVDSLVCRMSFGQRRLIELFRVIAQRPERLYLDEPFNFLDDEKVRLAVAALSDTYASSGLLVLSTHHQDEVAGLNGEVFRFDGQFPIRKLHKISSAEGRR